MSMLTFLVEDNPIIRENLIPTLEELGGAEVVAIAETEQEAADWLGSHSNGWDLAIVDLFLRVGNGIGVVAECRNRQTHQRVAVLTNYATDAIRQRCRQAGADAVFDNPRSLKNSLTIASIAPCRDGASRADGIENPIGAQFLARCA